MCLAQTRDQRDLFKGSSAGLLLFLVHVGLTCFLTSEDKSEISAKKPHFSMEHIHQTFPAVFPLSAVPP